MRRSFKKYEHWTTQGANGVMSQYALSLHSDAAAVNNAHWMFSHGWTMILSIPLGAHPNGPWNDILKLLSALLPEQQLHSLLNRSWE